MDNICKGSGSRSEANASRFQSPCLILMRTIFHESENSNYILTRALSRKTGRPPCPVPQASGSVSIVILMAVSPQCPDVMRTLNTTLEMKILDTQWPSVTHAVRLSQTNDWFVSLFPIVANVLIIPSIMITLSANQRLLSWMIWPIRGRGVVSNTPAYLSPLLHA